MRSSLLVVLGLGMTWAAGASAGDDRTPQPPKDSYVKVRVEVEVRGLLCRNDKGLTVASRFKAYQLYNPAEELPDAGGEHPADVYDLDFARTKDLRELAGALAGKEVVVTGMAELRMVTQPGRPGGSGGFGQPGPFPVPTWSLQSTILVTGLKSAVDK